MDFSLFYFADDAVRSDDRYGLLLETARFADTHDFSAVWTPERHFHEFGGQYPNPAVVGAALATVTDRIAIRAGSVVAPLHHPARIAEEWAVVDNLSHGRVGVSFASGWHATDFLLRPETYQDNKQVLLDTVETVNRLWRGEACTFNDGAGKPTQVRIHPAPVQADIPVWLTSAGSIGTFEEAGRRGFGVLTHLLGQDLEDLQAKIEAYRKTYAESGASGTGTVALMVHTFVGSDRDEIRNLVRRPFSAYLRSSVGLLVRAGGIPGVDLSSLSPNDIDFLVDRSFDRYFDTGGLFGTVEDCVATSHRFAEVGVDEVACLIDFGLPGDTVLQGLAELDTVRLALCEPAADADADAAAVARA